MDTPLCCTKVYMLLLCFGSRKHPPTPYMSGTFVLAPPPPASVAVVFFSKSDDSSCFDYEGALAVLLLSFLLLVSSDSGTYVGLMWQGCTLII